jgi:hypothetical protein
LTTRSDGRVTVDCSTLDDNVLIKETLPTYNSKRRGRP